MRRKQEEKSLTAQSTLLSLALELIRSPQILTQFRTVLIRHFFPGVVAFATLGLPFDSRAEDTTPLPPVIAPADLEKLHRSPFAEEVRNVSRGEFPTKAVGSIAVDPSFPCMKWFAQGPGPCTNADANMPPTHPSVGAVQAIVPHPSNADILYLAAVNGGVWRTTNATSPNYQWMPLTDTQATLSSGAMVMDRTDLTSSTLVVATGRRSSFGQSGALIGVLRSTDGGISWTALVGATLANQNLNSVVARGSLIMVGADGGNVGLYRGIGVS